MVLELKYLVLCRPETSNNPVTFLAGTTHFFLGGTQLCLEAPTWAWRYPLFMGLNSRDTILIGYWYPPFCTHWVVRLGRNRRCHINLLKNRDHDRLLVTYEHNKYCVLHAIDLIDSSKLSNINQLSCGQSPSKKTFGKNVCLPQATFLKIWCILYLP